MVGRLTGRRPVFDIPIHGPGFVVPEQLLRGIREHLCGLLETGVIWGSCEPATRLRGLVTLYFSTDDRKYRVADLEQARSRPRPLVTPSEILFNQCKKKLFCRSSPQHVGPTPIFLVRECRFDHVHASRGRKVVCKGMLVRKRRLRLDLYPRQSRNGRDPRCKPHV